ncbi:hypothetical protein OG552_28080 [Streptomyces sp. NBC_01476]|uniref:hypothetical protein n=1 Tax=Streptomyces sp. NBC_01476 TaxID=2903881 RepID=UPI002E2F2BE8|nr:hypothetical protein [Streptomyces sp. NBC_01476]
MSPRTPRPAPPDPGAGPPGPAGNHRSDPRPPVAVDVSGLPYRGAGRGLAAVAALARLGLAARRAGRQVRLTGADPGLRALLGRSGLAGEFQWEPEEGEEVRGVQE